MPRRHEQTAPIPRCEAFEIRPSPAPAQLLSRPLFDQRFQDLVSLFSACAVASSFRPQLIGSTARRVAGHRGADHCKRREARGTRPSGSFPAPIANPRPTAHAFAASSRLRRSFGQAGFGALRRSHASETLQFSGASSSLRSNRQRTRHAQRGKRHPAAARKTIAVGRAPTSPYVSQVERRLGTPNRPPRLAFTTPHRTGTEPDEDSARSSPSLRSGSDGG